MYVWLDALSNYVSALGLGSGDTALYDRYWPAALHLVARTSSASTASTGRRS